MSTSSGMSVLVTRRDERVLPGLIPRNRLHRVTKQLASMQWFNRSPPPGKVYVLVLSCHFGNQ